MHPKYFALHVTGTGYLSRIRTASPRTGEAFFACAIHRLHGEAASFDSTAIPREWRCPFRSNSPSVMIKSVRVRPRFLAVYR